MIREFLDGPWAMLIALGLIAYAVFWPQRRKPVVPPVESPTSAAQSATDVSVLVAVDEGLRRKKLINVEEQEVIVVNRPQPDLRFHVRNNRPGEVLHDVAIVTSLTGAKIIQPNDGREELGIIRPGETAAATLRQLRIDKPGDYQLLITVLYRYGPKNIVATLRALSPEWRDYQP